METKKAPIEIRNGLVCVTEAGVVGMVGEVNEGSAQFHPYVEQHDEEDETKIVIVYGPMEPIRVEKLTLAAYEQIPESHRTLTREQYAELGYV